MILLFKNNQSGQAPMRKSFHETTQRGALFDLFKVQVKAHYRQLPNGHLVHIDAYFDKRKGARKDPDKYKGKVIHADAKATTYMNHKGEEIEYHHGPHRELTQDDIHAHLNGALPVDEDMAHDVVMKEMGIKNFHEHLKGMVADEKTKNGKDAEYTNIGDASKHFAKTHTRPLLKQLRRTHGETTTLAEAYTEPGDKTLKNYFDHQASDPDAHHTKKALAKMAQKHAQKAIDEISEERMAMKGVDHMTPKDCPAIDGIVSKNADGTPFTLFGHQAEVLAKLSQLTRAIVDVDMGGDRKSVV